MKDKCPTKELLEANSFIMFSAYLLRIYSVITMLSGVVVVPSAPLAGSLPFIFDETSFFTAVLIWSSRLLSSIEKGLEWEIQKYLS